jgi:hypothetical protein
MRFLALRNHAFGITHRVDIGGHLRAHSPLFRRRSCRFILIFFRETLRVLELMKDNTSITYIMNSMDKLNEAQF